MNTTQLHRHYPAMLRAARRVVSCPEEAADCASDALLELLERPPADPAVSEALAVTVARRRAVDVVRAREIARRHAGRITSLPDSSTWDPAEAICDAAEARWLADVAATGLRPRVLRTFEQYVDGASPSHIAALTQVPLRTVQHDVSLARRALQRAAASVAAVVAAAIIGIRRLAPTAAVAPALVMAAALLLTPWEALPEGEASGPAAEFAPRQQPLVSHLRTGAPEIVIPARQPVAVAPSGSARGRVASPHRQETVVRTPAAGVRVYDADNGRDDDVVEDLVYCVQHLEITPTYTGC